jgi:hypothetical protein
MDEVTMESKDEDPEDSVLQAGGRKREAEAAHTPKQVPVVAVRLPLDARLGHAVHAEYPLASASLPTRTSAQSTPGSATVPVVVAVIDPSPPRDSLFVGQPAPQEQRAQFSSPSPSRAPSPAPSPSRAPSPAPSPSVSASTQALLSRAVSCSALLRRHSTERAQQLAERQLRRAQLQKQRQQQQASADARARNSHNKYTWRTLSPLRHTRQKVVCVLVLSVV